MLPVPLALFRAMARSTERTITVRKRVWRIGTMIPPLNTVPMRSTGCALANSSPANHMEIPSNPSASK